MSQARPAAPPRRRIAGTSGSPGTRRCSFHRAETCQCLNNRWSWGGDQRGKACKTQNPIGIRHPRGIGRRLLDPAITSRLGRHRRQENRAALREPAPPAQVAGFQADAFIGAVGRVSPAVSGRAGSTPRPCPAGQTRPTRSASPFVRRTYTIILACENSVCYS